MKRLAFAACAAFGLAGCSAGHSSSIPPLSPAAHQQFGATRSPRDAKPLASAVLADNPLVFYRLNETSGTTAADGSGHGYGATYGSGIGVGQSTVIQGDAAPTFPGGASSAATVVQSPASAALALTGPFTVEFWVNVPSSPGSGILWAQSYSPNASFYPAYVALTGGSRPYFTMQIDTANGAVDAYPAPVLGQPNHVVMTWNGTTLTGYVNGVAADSGTGSGTLVNYGNPYKGFTIGGPSGSAPGFHGVIADFAMYGSALSAARVQAHYNAGTVAPPPPPPPSGYGSTVLGDKPVAYYPMTETGGTTAADASGNGYTAAYGAGVSLAAGSAMNGQPAPVFPGGAPSASTLMRSPANAALGPTGAMSVELWTKLPSSLPSGTQFLYTQPYQSGAYAYPAYISLSGGANPFYTMQLHTNGGDVAVYATPVLGTTNHVVMTWNGTTLTGYVNGSAAGTATGSGPITNLASPYTGFTAGGAAGQQSGYAGAIGQLAVYAGALSAARVQAHYSAGTTTLGTLVWATGDPKLGTTGTTDDGQCGSAVVNGDDASFTVLRNTDTTYTFNGKTFNGASTCFRNMMLPNDPNTGTNFYLTMGAHYTWTFQTVLQFNGNYYYAGAPDGGLAADIPALVFQTHGDNPCDFLLIENTARAATANYNYPNVTTPGGLPTWNFHTCDESDFTGNAYNSPDTLYDGEVDNWQIDVVTAIQGQPGGSVVVHRNGTLIYQGGKSTCPSTTSPAACWWDFGAYPYYWGTSEEPPGFNPAGLTIQVNHLKLYRQ